MGKIDALERINGRFKNKHILSLDQFLRKDLELLFKTTKKIKSSKNKTKISNLLKGSIITLLFYEPSSRTFGSFAAAVKRLGGQTIEILDPTTFSSVSKGETLEDTVRVFETYSDAIIIRHPQKGAAREAANALSSPLINAGDGVGEHPTQAFLDLYTIYEKFGKLDNLTGVVAGDILNGRTIHSLIKGLSKFKKNTLYLLSPDKLRLKKSDFLEFKKEGIKLIEINSEKEMPKNTNFWYWTRVQKERFKNAKEYEKVKNSFVLNNKLINDFASKNTILMHPLPRVGEILTEVDLDPRALYLTNQMENGMYTRMALLTLILGKKIG
ncbi:MAG TPA: aspartate carbamoyltransferase [Patescibacteria group bacterium]|nr:aspartate carbamoyltransferase [Patescibacteria group bacterium]